MTLKSRLAKLEQTLSAPRGEGIPEGFDLEREEDRWADLFEQALDLLKDKHAGAVLQGWFLWLLAYLEYLTTKIPGKFYCARPPSQSFEEVRRYPRAMLVFLKVLPAELRVRSVTSGALWENSKEKWLRTWLWGMVGLHSRLPPDLPSTVLADLVTIQLDRAAEVDTTAWLGHICAGCGLARPSRREGGWGSDTFFGGRCPHCEAKETVWAFHGTTAVWQARARLELEASGGGRKNSGSD